MASVHLPRGESVDKEGENLEINTEVQQVSLLFPYESHSVFKCGVKCQAPGCSRDQEAANAVQSPFHTRASDKPAPFIPAELLAQQAEFLFNHLKNIFVKKK